MYGASAAGSAAAGSAATGSRSNPTRGASARTKPISSTSFSRRAIAYSARNNLAISSSTFIGIGGRAVALRKHGTSELVSTSRNFPPYSLRILQIAGSLSFAARRMSSCNARCANLVFSAFSRLIIATMSGMPRFAAISRRPSAITPVAMPP